VYRDNLQGPVKAIISLVTEKPTSQLMDVSAEAERAALKRMVDSFNSEVGKNLKGAGMQGVMSVYAEEVKQPIKGALSGRLLRAALIQVQEMKVNFETEMATVQRILEAQQLNLQIFAMFPAVALLSVSVRAVYSCLKWIGTDPLRPQMDLEHILHGIARQLLNERAAGEGTEDALIARGKRCLLAWQADDQFRRGQGPGQPPREAIALRKDIVRLGSPKLAVEHLQSLADITFKEIRSPQSAA